MIREEADNGTETSDLCNGLARLHVDAEAAIRVNGVKISKIHPGDSGTGNRSNSRSNLPAWLAASKAALAASQADHQETQRRISRLQEVTKGLSIIEFPEHNNSAAQVTTRGCVVGKDVGVAGGPGAEGPANEEKPCSNLHQLHRMTLGVVAEIVSFLEPQAVLSYARACKAAEDALWQDECWGGIFHARHLHAVVDDNRLHLALSSSARQTSSTSSQTDGKIFNVTALEGSDESIQNHGQNVRRGAPLRRAVISHARSLSRALCLFDVAVSDGGTTKAVVNGPARTAAAVASLRALVEITANVSDPVGRRAFADVRTGQLLLSIIKREHGSAVLQDLACAVLGNLFCDPEAAAGAEKAGQEADFKLLGNCAADKLLGRSKRSAIQELTALCSSTRPSPSSWSKSGGGGMRPVENLPGRQASRALINLLLPPYQVWQQLVTMPNNDDGHPRQPAVRSCSLPLMPSPARQEPQLQQGKTVDRFPQAPMSATDKVGKGGSGVGGAQSVSLAWEAGTEAGDGSLPGGGAGGGGGGREKRKGRTADRRTALPKVTAPAASGELVQLLSVAPTNKAEAAINAPTATPVPSDHASASIQVPTPGGHLSRPTQMIADPQVPSLAVPSPTRPPPTPEAPGVLPTRAAPSAAAIIERKPHPSPHYKSPHFGSLTSVATPTAPPGESPLHEAGCDPHDAEKSEMLDASLPTWANQRGACSVGGSQQVEETWQAFYFYHSGRAKDTFLVTLRFSSTSGGGLFGRGTDKLGNFVMEGAPLLGSTAGDTWFITKTYTGRGLPDAAGSGGWSGGAHVTHTAYLTDGLESNVKSPLDMPNPSRTGRHAGFWGVWEPVLGRAGGEGGGGGSRRASSTSEASGLPDGSRTTLSRRGGVFRLVPTKQAE